MILPHDVLRAEQSSIEVDGEKRFSHPLGSGPRFSGDGRYLLFTEGKSKVKEYEETHDTERGLPRLRHEEPAS